MATARYAPREFRSPRTLTLYTVGTARDLGFDSAGGRFVTTCDTHHTVLNSRTWQLAIDATHWPEWCADCQPKLVVHTPTVACVAGNRDFEFKAKCSCGWDGPRRATEQLAVADRNAHRKEVKS